jgi:molybdenum cofactor cytidylyltransferase
MQMAHGCGADLDGAPGRGQSAAMTPFAPTAAILILAAGRSLRMRGADKMLEPVGDQPLIRRQAQLALATGLPVWVTLPPDTPRRDAALADLAVQTVTVRDARIGLSRSITAGNAAIPSACGILVWLADLPEIETMDLVAILTAAKAAPNAIIRATTAAGKPGHPVYFPPLFRADLAALTGDEGAGKLLKRRILQTVFVALPGNRALTDLDTPEDWARWRANRGYSTS